VQRLARPERARRGLPRADGRDPRGRRPGRPRDGGPHEGEPARTARGRQPGGNAGGSRGDGARPCREPRFGRTAAPPGGAPRPMRLRGGPRRAAHAGLVAVVLVALAFLGCRSGDVSSSPQSIRVESSLGPLTLETVAEGLVTPWSVAFLPDGRFLVTERPGRMRVIDAEGHLSEPIAGLPKVHARGQGGLLDVVLAPDFASSRVIYFSYAEPVDDKARTAVMRARLDLEGLQLESAERIFAQHPAHRGNNHWGSRLVFGRDGMLFVTLGDRYDLRDQAQDLSSHIGKIVRLRPDGSVPGDNPLTTRAGTLPEIWSWGHRNIQGATLHPRTGELWIHEHGPRGGDEVNRILPGRNYGWPRITHGREYASGARIGEGTSAPDFE